MQRTLVSQYCDVSRTNVLSRETAGEDQDNASAYAVDMQPVLETQAHLTCRVINHVEPGTR